MDFEAVFGTLLLCAAALLILRTLGYRGVPVIAATVPVILCGAVIRGVTEAIEPLRSLAYAPELAEYMGAAFKVLGIGYLGGIGSDACRELGEVGIAKCISLAARAELIVITVPYIVKIVETLIGFINE